MGKLFGFDGRRVWPVLAAILVLSFSAEAWASHFRYGNITWKPRPDISASTVEFTVTSSWRRSAFSGSGGDGFAVTGDLFTPVILFFGDGTDLTVEHIVTGYSVAEDWINGIGRDPGTGNFFILHTYPSPDNGGSPWVADLNACCRIGTLVNAPNGSFRVVTLVESATGNRSPVSSLPPIVSLQEGGVRTFYVPGSDPDANTALRWRLATSGESGIPSQPAGLTIDSLTGQVSWNTSGLTVGSLYACQVVIEDRDATSGNLKTQVPVDFIIRIVAAGANNPPVFDSPPSPTCGDSLTVSIGSNLQFLVQASDADSGATVTLNSPGVPPGASMTPALPTSGNPVSSTFFWSPTTGQEGNYVVTFTATDQLGAQTLCSYTIQVNAGCDYQLALAPPSSTNQVGNAHTVTATLTNSAVPVQGGTVYFQVYSGPHSGVDGSDVTDANGEATFTYTGSSVGTDSILATVVSVPSDSCFAPVSSNAVTKTWTAPPNGFLQFDVPPTVPCGSALNINVGARLRFRVQASNTNTGQIVTLNVSGLPSGATMTPVLPAMGNPVASEFSWTPNSGQIGSYTVTFTATGGINSPVTCSYDINVLPREPCTPLPLAILTAYPIDRSVVKFNDLCNYVGVGFPPSPTAQPTQLEVVFDSILATDPSDAAVYKFNPKAELVSTFSDALLMSPYGITVQPTDSHFVWITNKFQKTVVKMNKGNGVVTSFPTNAPLPTLLTGIAFDPTSGHLFVAGSSLGSGIIVEVDPSNGNLLQTFTHPNLIGFNFGLAFSPGGNLYVSADAADAVLEFELSPTFNLVRTIQHVDLDDPKGLNFSATGDLFVAGKTSKKIVQFDTAGFYIATCPGNGSGQPTDVILLRTTKGDLTEDGLLTPADVVSELNCVFLEIFPAVTSCGCDLNCDSANSPADVVFELQAVFLGIPFPC